LLPGFTLLAAAIIAPMLAQPPAAGQLRLTVRSRYQPFKGTADWVETNSQQALDPRATALVITDMWDKHWCRGATARVNVLAGRMAPLVNAARARGVLIVHAPSETMDFYRDAPQRLSVLALPRPVLPVSLPLADPPLPIDDSGGGCDTGDQQYKAWTREHPAIPVSDQDFISDNGADIYTLLKEHHVRQIFYMGVHVNMCILNRSFGIRQMSRWGMKCVLIRDLTDAMYNPQDWPHVSHEQGTELVIEHIEKYWAPTVLASELMRGLTAAAAPVLP
jgi:nicotinamidase-related amidase